MVTFIRQMTSVEHTSTDVYEMKVLDNSEQHTAPIFGTSDLVKDTKNLPFSNPEEFETIETGIMNGYKKPAIMAELRLQKPAPEFRGTAVVDGEIKDISLADYRGKYVVFFFYPMDFTFVCPTEIIAFSDRVEEFRAMDCEVIACSCDSQFSHLAWINTPRKQGGLGNMKIPLLSDKTLEISKAYGALKEDEGISFRALFIIDGKGNLRQITMNDLPVGRSVDETLRLVQAFKFTDEHGEVCPAGWKPGKDTIKPDVKGKLSYFQKQN